MGRGLSDQQRTILAIGAALNADRNGGTPRIATPAPLDDRLRTSRDGRRVEWSLDWPDITGPLVLSVLGGFRVEAQAVSYTPPLVRRIDRTKTTEWGRDHVFGDKPADVSVVEINVRGYEKRVRRYDPATVSHSRRVSLLRAIESLADRDLLVGTRWYGPAHQQIDRESDLFRFYVDAPPGLKAHYLTAAGLAAVGDRWQELDVLELVEHWETARSVR